MILLITKSIWTIKVLPRIVIFCIDAFLMLIAAMMSFFIRNNFEFDTMDEFLVWRGSLFYTFFGLAVMYFTKIYYVTVPHTGIRDGLALFKTLFIQFIIIYAGNVLIGFYTKWDYIMPTPVLIITSFVAFSMIFACKLTVKELPLNGIREIKIEDLLERKSIALKNERVIRELKGSVVLVTGAAGSIGSELAKQTAHAEPAKLLLLDKAESALYDVENELKGIKESIKAEVILADIRDKDGIDEVFRKFNPDYVFHAAAYKHVPMMEKYPKEAFKCNVLGTKNVANAALKYQVKKFVMVSTDKAVNPTNVMGATKRLAEMYIQSLNLYQEKLSPGRSKTLFITTRFGNVLGSNGSVIPLFRKQIREGGPVTVTHPEMTRYFMTIPEACELVLEAGVMGMGGEIYVFDMGKPVKIRELAERMIHLSGKKLGVDIHIEYVGLREGEKMYEELLSNSEKALETHHDKILIAKVATADFLEIDMAILNCTVLAETGNDFDLVKGIKHIVPEFISAASRFGELDKNENIESAIF